MGKSTAKLLGSLRLASHPALFETMSFAYNQRFYYSQCHMVVKQTTLSLYTMKMYSPKQRNGRWKRKGVYQIYIM